MSSRWRLLLLAGVCALATACGAGGDDGTDGVASMSEPDSPSSSAAPAGDDGKPDIDQMRAYAKCMREHGVDMDDPDPNGGGGIAISADGPGEKEKVDKGNEACKHLLPNGGKPDKPTAEDLDRARETAKCLRDHGIDVKEPTMEDPGINVSAGDGGNDPEKVNKAMEECAPDGAATHGEKAGK
jgi:hypothetical protein